VRLSRDDILKAEDSATEEVDVPEWGGTVLVRGMTGRERDEFELSFRQRGRRGEVQSGMANLSNVRAKLVARCCVDDDGNRLFTDADVAALGEKSGDALDRLNDVAARLSGMTAGDMEEMAEDFGPAGGDGSPSTSPSASARRSKSSSARHPAGS
jgi:hypothetical protein